MATEYGQERSPKGEAKNNGLLSREARVRESSRLSAGAVHGQARSVRTDGPPTEGLGEMPIGELFQNFLGEGQRLAREEVRLAKAELRDEAKAAGKAGGSAAAGGVITHVGFLALTFSAIALLGMALPIWVSALIVGAIYLLVGTWMTREGVRKLKTMERRPRETVETLQEDRQWASEMMHAVRSRTRANA